MHSVGHHQVIQNSGPKVSSVPDPFRYVGMHRIIVLGFIKMLLASTSNINLQSNKGVSQAKNDTQTKFLY